MEKKGELFEKVPLCFPDFIKIDHPGILRDATCVSHALFGTFIKAQIGSRDN